MRNRLYGLLVMGVAGGALVLANPAPTSIDELGVQPAFAKDNGNGGGGGGGSGNGGGGGGGNSGGASSFASSNSNAAAGNGNSGGAPGHNKAIEAKGFASSGAKSGGAAANQEKALAKAKVKGLDAKVGALHAVNANLQAFIHANPNSRVGRIAAYAQALVGVEDAVAALAAAEEALTGATAAFDLSLASFKVSYPGYADYQLGTLQARFGLLSTSDPTVLTPAEVIELADLTAVLGSQPALDLIAAEAQVATEESNLAAAELVADQAIEDAANKPVDSEVEAWVQTKLEEGGILDYYRQQ